MFELDWAKLLIIMIVAIVVVGPKELPAMLRTLGRTLAILRRHAEQFRAQFEQSMQEITKDVGIEDIKNDLRKLGELNPANQIRNSLDQALRDVPPAQTYLRGEPAAGAAMAAFEEPPTPAALPDPAPAPSPASASLSEPQGEIKPQQLEEKQEPEHKTKHKEEPLHEADAAFNGLTPASKDNKEKDNSVNFEQPTVH
jgi:sec-independent protein translocase protein TatB